MINLSYLAGYPPQIIQTIQNMAANNTLNKWLEQRYPYHHKINTDKLLYEYTMAIKLQYFRNTKPIAKVFYDNQLDLIKGTLGTNTFSLQKQGNNLKRKNEIRIASFLKEAPEAFLNMLIVHELAHLKEKDHNKAFYQLCCHILPNYHQLEFDLRVWLTSKN